LSQWFSALHAAEASASDESRGARDAGCASASDANSVIAAAAGTPMTVNIAATSGTVAPTRHFGARLVPRRS